VLRGFKVSLVALSTIIAFLAIKKIRLIEQKSFSDFREILLNSLLFIYRCKQSKFIPPVSLPFLMLSQKVFYSNERMSGSLVFSISSEEGKHEITQNS
jgi:hypothetical protein